MKSCYAWDASPELHGCINVKINDWTWCCFFQQAMFDSQSLSQRLSPIKPPEKIWKLLRVEFEITSSKITLSDNSWYFSTRLYENFRFWTPMDPTSANLHRLELRHTGAEGAAMICLCSEKKSLAHIFCMILWLKNGPKMVIECHWSLYYKALN